jgi:hypothetical protein
MRVTGLFKPRSSDVRSLAASDVGPNARVVRASHVASTTRDGLTVLLDLERGRYHTLNEIAGRIWTLLADATTVDAIARVIQEEYDAPIDGSADRLQRDITTLLVTLGDAGLLQVESEAPTPS